MSSFTQDTQTTHEAQATAATRKPVVAPKLLTAEEVFTEAARTQLENTRALELAMRLEAAQRKQAPPKPKQQGPMIKRRSRIGCPNTITFTNVDAVPAVINARAPPRMLLFVATPLYITRPQHCHTHALHSQATGSVCHHRQTSSLQGPADRAAVLRLGCLQGHSCTASQPQQRGWERWKGWQGCSAGVVVVSVGVVSFRIVQEHQCQQCSIDGIEQQQTTTVA